RNRNLHAESGALAVVRLDPDAPVEPVDELAADVEPEPGAADASRHVRIEAIELLEDATALGRRDAEPVVAHAPDDVSLLALEPNGHRPTVGRVLDGVVDEVDEYLAELLLVGPYRGKPLRRGEVESDPCGQMDPRGLDDAGRERLRIDGLDRELEPAGVEMAREEQVVDDLRQPVRL